MAIQVNYVLLLLTVAVYQLVQASGEVPHFQDADQSSDSILQGKSTLEDEIASLHQNEQSAEQTKRYAGTQDEKPPFFDINAGNPLDKPDANQGKPLQKGMANEKRFFGKVIEKVKQKLKKKYWTKQRFIQTLKELGILNAKDIHVFTAPKELIQKLLQNKNHVIDTFNKTCQCTHDEPMAQDAVENNKDDYNDSNEVNVIQNDDQDDKLDKIDNNDDLPDNDQEDDLEKILKSTNKASVDMAKIAANDDQEAGQDVQKRDVTVDLCHETFSTMYVLAYPDANLAYKIPNVHCPNSICRSNSLGIDLGKCVKKEKELLLYVINSKFQFTPKTVTCGCACECHLYSDFA